MANYYHLLVHTPRGNLGQAMWHLNGLYTQGYNRQQKTDGPLFRGRYQAVLIDADTYLTQVSRYIHLNPVNAKIVKKPGSYRWSSYPTYLGKTRAPPWLHLQPTLGMLAKRNAGRRYQSFVEAGVDEALAAFYGKGRLAPVLGSKRFRRRVKRQPRHHAPTELPDSKRLLVPPTLGRIARETAKQFNVPITRLYQTVKGRGQSNLSCSVAIALSRRQGGYPLRTIAAEFGLGHYSAVSAAARRLDVLRARDRSLSAKVSAIQRSLSKQ